MKIYQFCFYIHFYTLFYLFCISLSVIKKKIDFKGKFSLKDDEL